MKQQNKKNSSKLLTLAQNMTLCLVIWVIRKIPVFIRLGINYIFYCRGCNPNYYDKTKNHFKDTFQTLPKEMLEMAILK